MKQILVFAFRGAVLATLCQAAEAQPSKIPHIGYLVGTKAGAIAARTEAFREGLRELGYVERKSILVDYRYADGNPDRERKLAAELVRQKVDVIVTGGPT